jgi:hypothetical protein
VRHLALGGAGILVLVWASLASGQTAATPQGEVGGAGAQRGGGGRGAAAAPAVAAKPTPRKADGKPILGTVPGEVALWLPAGGGGERFVNADTADPSPDKLRISEVPMQPWARALLENRLLNQLEPHTRCKPSGGPRQFLTPYGVEILEMPDLKQILILDLGGPHTYRAIYMDGRPHPKELQPSYYGHSTGRWEGDTLVIDTVGFNEKFWIDRQGMPHTDKMRMTERLTRTDYNTIKYEVTIDDPGAYTKPWTSGFNLRWTANSELFEYVCQDNNYAPDLMVGTQEFVDRTSKIVP